MLRLACVCSTLEPLDCRDYVLFIHEAIIIKYAQAVKSAGERSFHRLKRKRPCSQLFSLAEDDDPGRSSIAAYHKINSFVWRLPHATAWDACELVQPADYQTAEWCDRP